MNIVRSRQTPQPRTAKSKKFLKSKNLVKILTSTSFPSRLLTQALT